MTLSDISIRKPVFAWMLMIGLIVFGGICFRLMGISRLPDVDFPVLTISVTWVGAAPETMESAVADVIEDAVMSVEGIKDVTSKVQEGSSSTTVEFEMSTDINIALQEVQTKIAQAQRRLPNTIDPPIVTKSNPEDQPIIWAALTGPNSLRDKILFVRDHLKDNLTTVSGVGDVVLGGYVDPNMRIWLDNKKMTSLQITVDDVMKAISTGTLLTPSGYIDTQKSETNVRVFSESRTPQDFASLLIPARAGAPIWTPIRIGDVGKVEEGLADVRRISRFNGEPTVGLGVIKQRGSNAVAVADDVKKRIDDLGKLLPANLKLLPVIDTTKFIRESTNELLFTLGLSALLTSLVCYLFLGSFGSAINVILAIPTSLIGSFIVLKLFGFTINTFTLLALSLSIGIVVDDAIMVLENIVRYFETGMSRVKASLIGAHEITGAATASSVAILAIFLPVVFMKGIIGKFFLQFGVAMSVAVVLSLLEALTLAPMRCSEFLTHSNNNWLIRHVERFMTWLTDTYRRILERCLNYRWTVLATAILIFVASIFLVGGIPKEFVPAQDQSLFTAIIYTPVGSSLEYTDQVYKRAEKILKDRPEVLSYMVSVGGYQGGLVNQGNMFIVLKDPGDRTVTAPFKKRPSQQEFMGYIRKEFNQIPGAERASIMDPSQQGFTTGRSLPISFSVQGPDWEKLASFTTQIMDKMKASKLMTDVDSDYSPNMPQARIYPDRESSARYGVTVDTIANTIAALVGSMPVGKYTDDTGRRDDIRVKLQDQENRTSSDITRINVRNQHGEMIPLGDVVKIENKSALLSITRYNRERSNTVNANPASGVSQADAMTFVEKTAKEVLPAGYHIQVSGSSQAFRESFQSLWIALALGIFVAYMVLGAQFNSFIHPITVLLALPFSFTGAFIAMRLTGDSLNIYSMIGMLLLMGIVKKNSILLVDFTNHRRREGIEVREALLEACPLRLRPILMTSFATIAAAIPAAFAFGPGAETTRPMAVVVIGGVLLSTILTLVVVPCAYSLFSKLESHKHERELNEALRETETERRSGTAVQVT
jgi:hydrophobe/amphiphile efflux-1 (HAE1) family protein